jgi:hypothetical protein
LLIFDIVIPLGLLSDYVFGVESMVVGLAIYGYVPVIKSMVACR